MNLIRAIIFLAGGLVILAKCADLLVAGAVALAKRLGVSPLIIGLTIVAMGTSAPEAAASIAAVLRESGGGDMAVGNVYGSNIANLALIGGLISLIRPLKVKKQTLRREVPVMLLTALLLWPILHSLSLSRPEGLMLLAVFTVLVILAVYTAKREAVNERRDTRHAARDTQKSVLFVVIGLAGLAFGARVAVEGAVFIGGRIGLSDAVIGLTIIAIGTSLPELATCMVAAIKGQHDISVGNLVGSNIFNTLLVTGGASVVRPFEVGQRFAAGTDYWIMIIVSGAFATLVIVGRRIISRPAGALLLGGYIAYIVYLLIYTRAL